MRVQHRGQPQEAANKNHSLPHSVAASVQKTKKNNESLKYLASLITSRQQYSVVCAPCIGVLNAIFCTGVMSFPYQRLSVWRQRSVATTPGCTQYTEMPSGSTRRASSLAC